MKKRFLSYEAKIIIFISILGLVAFILVNFLDYINKLKQIIITFYKQNIIIYPFWFQVSVLLLPFVIYIFIKLIRKNRCKYLSDNFYGIKWTWKWQKNDIVNLQCFCPICNEELYYDDTTSNFVIEVSKVDFICDKCQKVVGSIANENKKFSSSKIINKEIQRQVLKKLNKM